MKVQSSLLSVSPAAHVQEKKKNILGCPGIGFDKSPQGMREFGILAVVSLEKMASEI